MTRPCNFRLTDNDIFDLGRALSHIRTLNLTPGCRTPPRVTFVSLIRLSRICGNLEYLAINVDFASIFGGPNLPNQSNITLKDGSAHPHGERSRLNTLTVGNSPLPDTPRCEWMVALALATTFPSITHLFSFGASEMRKRWDEVREDIFVCQKIFHTTRGEGKRLNTVSSVIPISIRSLQTPPQPCKLLEGFRILLTTFVGRRLFLSDLNL